MITATSSSLLRGLRDPQNDAAWTEMFSRYRPMLESFARRLGLNDADAQDAAQDALLAFAKAYRDGKYDRDKGRLRTWLSGIAKYKVRDIQRRRKDVGLGGQADETALLDNLPDEHTMSELWEAEWHRAILKQCMQEVRGQVEPSTMKAFELFVLEEWPAEKVASHLNMSRSAVYQSKNRVISRMREHVEYLKEHW